MTHKQLQLILAELAQLGKIQVVHDEEGNPRFEPKGNTMRTPDTRTEDPLKCF